MTVTATLGLLETDTLATDLIPDYGSYGRMFARYFDSLDGRLGYRYYQVQRGELPQHPRECAAYLITGSKAGVYDDLPWLAPLRNWIIDFHQRGARLIGICFGHQMIAHSLGGSAAKSAQGWGLGVLSTRLSAAGQDYLGQDYLGQLNIGQPTAPLKDLRLIHSHQDQVEALPAGAQVLAGSEFCRYAAFAMDDRVLCFQGHPEFTPGYFRRLFACSDGDPDDSRLTAALATLDKTTDHQRVGRLMLAFIHRPFDA